MWPFTKKKKLPARRNFAGAQFNRLVSDWITNSNTQDAELRGSLTALRNRSRQLGRDNDYIRNFFRIVQNNVVGQGIPFQSQVRMQRGGKLDEATNDQIERAWERWCYKQNCHTAGRLCFQDIERILIKTTAESGEFIVRMIYQPMGDSSKVPLALELIEPDRLDENMNGRANGSGNEIRMGVEVDPWRRPVAYHFFPVDQNDITSNAVQNRGDRVRIPAAEIIHGFVSDRMTQTRGTPWLASAMMRLHHMQGYEEAEVIAARASASLMGFIESPEEGTSLDDAEVDGQSVTEFEPGLFKKLFPGEKMNIPSIPRPGGQFDPFMRAQLRGVAAGIGSSYESLSRDYSQSNYSSSRLALIDDRDNWKVLQSWILRTFHQVVFEKWLQLAVLSGELKLKTYEVNPEAYKSVKWMPRGWSWIDPAKEVAAYKDAVRNGFMTQSDVIAQSGGDLEELMSQRAREVDMAKILGLVFDTNPEEVNSAGADQGQGDTPTTFN